LDSNLLDGAIPFSIGLLVALTAVSVENNRLSELPQSLVSLAALRYLALLFKLHVLPGQPAALSRWWHDIGARARRVCRRSLSLCNNSFDGTLPAFLVNATWIT
jgi:hypothetical protein